MSIRQVPAQRSARWVALLAFLALVGASIVARDFVVPLLLAALLALVLGPVVALLSRYGVPRFVGSLLCIAALLAAGILAISALSETLTDLLAQAPALWQRAQEMWIEFVRSSSPRRVVPATWDFNAALSAAGWLVPLLNDALVSIGVSLVLTHFMLVYGNGLTRALIIASTRERLGRRRVLALVGDTRRVVQRYLATISLINMAYGTLAGASFAVIGVEHAAAFGVLAALMNFVPFVGAALMFVVVALSSVAQYGLVSYALLAPGAFLMLHVIESQFVTPLVLGQRMSINPLVVIGGVLSSVFLWGLGGAFLAVPLLTALKTVLDQTPRLAPWGRVIGRNTLGAPRRDALSQALRNRLATNVRAASTRKTRNNILAIPTAPAAMPPKPNSAAISAITKKTTA